MFRTTREYKEIKAELKEVGILDKEAIFECLFDNIATYGYKTGTLYHEFCLICKDDLLRQMKIIDLLDLRNVGYFSHAIYYEQEGKEIERIGMKRWSMYDHLGIN